MRISGSPAISSPREQFYYARELYYHERYQDAAAAFENFLDTGEGWVENNIDACRQLSACYAALGRDKEALAALLRSFSYDAPRAEACCDLGGYFLARGQVGTAVFWYELALTRHADPKTGAFVSPTAAGISPASSYASVTTDWGTGRRPPPTTTGRRPSSRGPLLRP